MPITIACAQIEPAKGQVHKNLDAIASAIRQASEEGADLVLLPETATSGYFLEGGVIESALTSDELVQELAGRLAGISRAVDVLVGFY